MDKIDDLKVELKAMERIAKVLHDLPNTDSVIRVSTWIQEVVQTEHFPSKEDAPTFAVIEKMMESLPHSELNHLRHVIANLIGEDPRPAVEQTHLPKGGDPVVLPSVSSAMLPSGRSPAPPIPPTEA